MVWSEQRKCRVDKVREMGLSKLLKDYTLVSGNIQDSRLPKKEM
jgi:hypothetical protein